MILWFGKKKKKQEAEAAAEAEKDALKAQLEDSAAFQEATGEEELAEKIEETIEKIEDEGVE